MFGISRLVALILAFTLGFSIAGGALVGGIAIALTSFRVRDLEKHKIVDIPDELFIGDDFDVDLLNLTAFEFVDELKYIYSLGDEVNINYIQDRYGLIFHDKLNAVLSDETREMPLKQLLSKDGFSKVLGSVYIGNIEKYTCYNADGTLGGDPNDDTSYWMTSDGKKIVGLEDIIADYSINDFVSGKINTNTLFEEISIGDVLGYTQEGEDWFDKDGNKVTGVVGAFAGSTIHSVGSDIDNVMIGEILGYQKNENDEWCKENEETGELEKVTGVMAVFADSKINDIGDEIESAKLGELLGYEKGEDEKWYKTNEETGEKEKVTGVMAVFADSDINGIGDKIESAELGELLGYEKGEDGEWYKTETVIDADGNVVKDENGNDVEIKTKVTGVMAVFSDCNIDGIGDKLESAKLGELLGYELMDGVWYKTVIDEETGEEKLDKVTGAMAVFADSNIDGVGDQIEKTEVGKLLGYELIEGVWYQPADELDEEGNRIPVSGFMSKISASTINNMDKVFEKLVIGDIVKEEDRQGGIFAIIPPDTNIENIGGAVNNSIKNSPLQFFINEGLISFKTGEEGNERDMAETLDALSYSDDEKKFIYTTDEDFEDSKKYYEDCWTFDESNGCYVVEKWRTQPLTSSFAYIINLMTKGLPSVGVSD